MLLFRDYLRANDVDRERYAGAKRELAAHDWTYMQQYADAKTAIVQEIMSRAAAKRQGESHEGAHHQRHGGRRRHRQVGADDGRRPDVRGGPPALHRGDQRRRPRGQGGRRDRDRRHGLPRRRQGLELQLADPRPARPGVRVRRAAGVDGVHGLPRAGLRRCALRRHARACRHARRRHEPHRLRSVVAEPLLQRHARRRDGDQRGAVRQLGLPGAARHWRRGRLPRGPGAARRRADDGRRQDAGSGSSARVSSPPSAPAS